MKLDLESRLLLSLIAKTSFDRDVPFLEDNEKIEDVNWSKVYGESATQAVLLFTACAVFPYKNLIPEDIYRKWYAFSKKAFATNSYVAGYQNELTDFLAKNNYKYVILKGLASASYYENPDMRMSGDVDFLIDRNLSDEIAKKIQNELEYNKYTEIEHKCHVKMTRTYENIEMHFEIAGIPDGNKGYRVRQFIKNILDDTQNLSLNGCEFSAPSHLFHGVVILLHTLHHITGDGLGLRHLCDWGAYVNKTAKMDFWDIEFVPFLKEIGLYTFASVMSSVCKRYMGIDMPLSLEVHKEELCEEIICEIFKSGNFGIKDEEYHDSSLLVAQEDNTQKSSFITLLKKLDSAVKSHWPQLNKWKILLPFAYIYFILRYYLKVFKGERHTITSLMPEANRRKEIYKKLRIYEDIQ